MDNYWNRNGWKTTNDSQSQMHERGTERFHQTYENTLKDCCRSHPYPGSILEDPRSESREGKMDLQIATKIHLLNQPAPWQIANYNIFPAPVISVSPHPVDNVTCRAYLIELDGKREIKGGFRSGDTKGLRNGQGTIHFGGVKLNKMGPIKNELNIKNSKQLSTQFCIQFKIGSAVTYSQPFRILSSCSQLPTDVKESVRPSKRQHVEAEAKENNDDDIVPNTQPTLHNAGGSSPQEVNAGGYWTNYQLPPMQFSYGHLPLVGFPSHYLVPVTQHAAMHPSSIEAGQVPAESDTLQSLLHLGEQCSLNRNGQSSKSCSNNNNYYDSEISFLRGQLEEAIQNGDHRNASEFAAKLAILYREAKLSER